MKKLILAIGLVAGCGPDIRMEPGGYFTLDDMNRSIGDAVRAIFEEPDLDPRSRELYEERLPRRVEEIGRSTREGRRSRDQGAILSAYSEMLWTHGRYRFVGRVLRGTAERGEEFGLIVEEGPRVRHPILGELSEGDLRELREDDRAALEAFAALLRAPDREFEMWKASPETVEEMLELSETESGRRIEALAERVRSMQGAPVFRQNELARNANAVAAAYERAEAFSNER